MRKVWPLLYVISAAASAGVGCSNRGDRSVGPRSHPDHSTRAAPPARPSLQPPPRSPDEQVDALVRENLDAELLAQPVTATWLGAHAYDDRLDDVRPEAQAREVARLLQLIDRLASVDVAALDANRAFDHEILLKRAQAQLFVRTELRPLERNPLAYCALAQGAIFELLTDDYLAPADRLRAINARLWKLRPLFDEARRNLRPSAPDLLVRRAAEELLDMRGFLSETLPRALQGAPEPRLLDDLRNASGEASRAVEDFANWLQHDLLPRAQGQVAIGRDRLMTQLRLSEGIDVTPELLVALGEREIKEARRRSDEAVHAFAPPRPPLDVLLKMIEDDHGKPEELMSAAQEALEAAVAFVRAQKLWSAPEPERPKVVEMPPGLWGFALLQMPGPLEPKPHDAFLYVDPVGKSWSDKRRNEHLHAFNRSTMVRTLVHEGVAHYMQAEIARHAPTTMQKIAGSLLFVEGWASYVEEMLLAEGFMAGDAKLRVVTARASALRAARLVAAVRLHALGTKFDDVVKIFTDEIGLDDYSARREAERVAADPLVLADALGRVAILKLRDDWRTANPSAALGAFHDALLHHGTASPILLRKLLMPADRASPL
jgi:uncharacterized protein (DUF885 family)